ncbi:helix-turn-helix domain-containing protein [Sinomonas cellulolyticus]|uniref:Transcriptional regulator n=1 Tax=Sinomonas cellulolyticus TaxID=2801916 RepID=A0ABS1JXD7_9MICC|nr:MULTISPECIES: helix-turn-helix domain-containing protein [Sinomonas]MBL0704025.1 transcriptional regulator [Sinomonas cellulolyticus]
MTQPRLEAALTVFDDPTAKARELLRLHRSWRSTLEVPGPVRTVVARAWQRQGAEPASRRTLADAALAERRERAAALSSVLPLLRDRLMPLAAEAGNELVVSDDEGYVLWVSGPAAVRRKSEQLGFIQGARWRERDVGVNSLGTAMEERRPVQIFGPEHGAEEQHTWVCTSAPILGPKSGAPLGVVTLSGSYRTAHPHTLSLVSMTAREAMDLLGREHDGELRRLALLAGGGSGVVGRRLVVDDAGWVAVADGFGVGDRIRLPAGLADGVHWVSGVGQMRAERLDGGWVLHPAHGRAELHLKPGPPPSAVLGSAGGETEIPLTARHFELLALLAEQPHGLESREVLARLKGVQTEVTVRAEFSRLRKRLGGLIESRPYRLTVPAVVVR